MKIILMGMLCMDLILRLIYAQLTILISKKTGNIEVALQFAEQLPQAIHAIFYLEFDNVLEITDKRVAIVTIYKWMV